MLLAVSRARLLPACNAHLTVKVASFQRLAQVDGKLYAVHKEGPVFFLKSHLSRHQGKPIPLVSRSWLSFVDVIEGARCNESAFDLASMVAHHPQK